MSFLFDKIDIFLLKDVKNSSEEFPLPTILKKDSLFIKINTNEGIFGVGEPSQYYNDNKKLINLFKDLYSTFLFKKKILNYFKIRNHIANLNIDNFEKSLVLSAFTQAYYDLYSKFLNKPTYEVINKNKKFYKKKIPLYASGGMIFKNQKYDTLIDEVLKFKEEGFKGWKFRPKTPNSNPNHFKRKSNPPSFNKRELISFCYKLRKLVGDQFPLMIDFGSRIKNIKDAEFIINNLIDLNFYFIEEPMQLNKANYLKLNKLSKKLKIAIGETINSMENAIKLSHFNADILQPDSNLIEIDQIMKLINLNLAEEIILHNWSFPISMLSNFHIASASNKINLVEFSSIGENQKNRVLRKKLDIRNGFYFHNASPGFGYTLNENNLIRIKT